MINWFVSEEAFVRTLLIVFFCIYAAALYAVEDSRVSVAVLDFEPKAGISVDFSDFITERVRIELFKTGQYRVVERKDMARVIDEQKLSLSGLTGSQYAVKLGELLSARMILVGSVTKIEDMYYVSIKLLNVESGEMEYGDTAQAPNMKGLADVSGGLVRNMVASLRQPGANRTVSNREPVLTGNSGIDSAVNFFMARVSEVSNIKPAIDSFTSNFQPVQPVNPVIESNYALNNNGGAGFNFSFSATASASYPLNPVALSVSNTSYSISALLVGGSWFWNFSQWAGIGVAGYGIIPLEYSAPGIVFGSGFGGILLDIGPRKWDFFRPSVSILFGVGGYGISSSVYTTNTNTQLAGYEYEPLAGGVYITVMPRARIGFAFASFLEFGLEAGYIYSTRLLNTFTAAVDIRYNFN